MERKESNLSFKNIFKRETKLASYIIVCMTIVVISLSYALFFQVDKNSKNQEIIAGDLKFTYTDGTEITSTSNSICFEPMSEEEANLYASDCSYEFSVQNTGSLKATYTLKVTANETNTMDNTKLKFILRKKVGNTLQVVTGYPKLISEITNNTLITEEMESKEIIVYSAQIYVDETLATDNDTNQTVSYKIEGTGVVHEEQPINTASKLNGADPVLGESLIPVKISDTGSVTRANTDEEWYDYENKVWANAIILNDESTSSNYKAGDIIPESAIESYFVWIPRYRYKIFDEGNYETLTNVENRAQTINVVFENKNTPASTGSKVGEWLTHPAFTSLDVNGIWVGKFETGTTLTSDYNVRNGEAIQIKPNVNSWRNIQLANAFYTTYDYKRELDSHMMKNTEWGAVAYLQHSVYGSQASVRINNNLAYLTGYAAVTEPTCGSTNSNEACNIHESTSAGVDGTYTINYLNPGSVVASTTGNYSGVYDMSGGVWEYVMGVIVDQSGNPMSGRNNTYNSGFNGPLGCPTCDSDTSGVTSVTNGLDFPEAKYYDTYAYANTGQQYNRRILGDATGEMGPFETRTYTASNGTIQTRNIGSWYVDHAYFVSASFPWFLRGAHHPHGSETGVFAFINTNGATGSVSFRVVLSP